MALACRLISLTHARRLRTDHVTGACAHIMESYEQILISLRRIILVECSPPPRFDIVPSEFIFYPFECRNDVRFAGNVIVLRLGTHCIASENTVCAFRYCLVESSVCC